MSRLPCCSKVVSVGRCQPSRGEAVLSHQGLCPCCVSDSAAAGAEEHHPVGHSPSLGCSSCRWRWRLQPGHDLFVGFSLPLADRQHAKRSHPLKACVSSCAWRGCSMPGAPLREVTPGASNSRPLQWAQRSRLLCLCSGPMCAGPWERGHTEHSKALTTGLDSFVA